MSSVPVINPVPIVAPTTNVGAPAGRSRFLPGKPVGRRRLLFVIAGLLLLVALSIGVVFFMKSRKSKSADIAAEVGALSVAQKDMMQQLNAVQINMLTKTNAVSAELGSLQNTFVERLNTLQNHDANISQQLSALMEKNMIVQTEMKDLLNSGKVSESGRIDFDMTTTALGTTMLQPGPIINTQRVEFKKAYRHPPNVMLSLMGVNIGSAQTRFTLAPVNITQKGFDVQLVYWHDTKLGGIAANYIVMENM